MGESGLCRWSRKPLCESIGGSNPSLSADGSVAERPKARDCYSRGCKSPGGSTPPASAMALSSKRSGHRPLKAEATSSNLVRATKE